MHLARRLLLSVYHHATARQRKADARLRIAQKNEPVQILFYHRIANTVANPWTMDCNNFAKQIDWLSQRFDVVSLAEAQRRLRSGVNDRPSVVITFDDGYADNCDFAIPYLLERELPFVYFVTSGNILSGDAFPHDVERGELLAPNSVADIRELAEAGVEIGAHTRTHANLAIVSSQQLYDEIVGSRLDLEEMTGRPVQHFAFPFGQHTDMTPEGFRVAYQAGFSSVSSAYGGYNFPGGDAFHLERIHADPDFMRTRHWLSVDRRKLRNTHSFGPGNYAANLSVESAGNDNCGIHETSPAKQLGSV